MLATVQPALRPNNVIRYGDKWICAACKPTFFQRLREGAALPSTGAGPLATEADFWRRIRGGYRRLSRQSLGSVQGQRGHYDRSDRAGVSGHPRRDIVPYLNWLLGILFNGPLMGGLWLFLIKKVRGQETTVGDAFGGPGVLAIGVDPTDPRADHRGVYHAPGDTGDSGHCDGRPARQRQHRR